MSVLWYVPEEQLPCSTLGQVEVAVPRKACKEVEESGPAFKRIVMWPCPAIAAIQPRAHASSVGPPVNPLRLYRFLLLCCAELC